MVFSHLGVGAEFAMESVQPLWHIVVQPLCVVIRRQDVAFGLLWQFSTHLFVLGIEIAQQSNSCGDNCTPQ